MTVCFIILDVEIGFTEEVYSIVEGNPVIVCATLTGTLARDVSFTFEPVSGTATSK